MSNNIGNNQNNPKITLSNGKTFDLSKLDKLINKSVSGSVFARYDNVNNGGNGDGIFSETEISFIKNKLMNYQNSENSVSDNEISELINGENAAGSNDMERMLDLLNELEGEETEVRSNNPPPNESDEPTENPVLTKYTVQPGDTPERIAQKLGLRGDEAKAYARQLAQHFKDNGFVNSRGWLKVGDEITLLGNHEATLNNMVGYSTDKQVLNARYASTTHAQNVRRAQQANEQPKVVIPESVTNRAEAIRNDGGTCEIKQNSDGSFTILQTDGTGYFKDTNSNKIELLFDKDGNFISQTNYINNGIIMVGKMDNGKMKWERTDNSPFPNYNFNFSNLQLINPYNVAASDNTYVATPYRPERVPAVPINKGQPSGTPARARVNPTPTPPPRPRTVEELSIAERWTLLKPGEGVLPENIQNKILNYRLQGKEINLSIADRLLPEAPQSKVIDLAAEGLAIVNVSGVYDENNQLIAYRIEHQKDNNNTPIPLLNTSGTELTFIDLEGNEIAPINNPSRLDAVQRNDQGREVRSREVTYRNLGNGRQTTDRVAATISMEIPAHLKNNEQAIEYANALATHKAELMAKFGISNEEYNNLAVLAMGIAEQETHFGEDYFTTTDGSSTDFQSRTVAKQVLDAVWYGEYENSDYAKVLREIILSSLGIGNLFMSENEKNAFVKSVIFDGAGDGLGKVINIIRDVKSNEIANFFMTGGSSTSDLLQNKILDIAEEMSGSLITYKENINNGTKSYGFTQAKIDQFMREPAIASQLKEFGITCGEDIRKDPEKQAIATMIILNNKRITAESETWQTRLANNNANISTPNQHITTNDLIALLWNGNSKKTNALINGNLVLQKSNNGATNTEVASYARNVRAYTNAFFEAEVSQSAQSQADHLGAIPQGNNGQLGSVIFLANKYSTDVRNNQDDIAILTEALNKSTVPKEHADALILAVRNGDIAFGHGLTEDEAKSITTNDVLSMLASLQTAKERTTNLVDPAKIREAALDVQDEFRANYLASRQFTVNNSDISSSNRITTMGSSEIVNERLVERRETKVTNAHRNGRGGGYQRAIIRDNSRINSGAYTGFAVQADLGVNPYDANGNLIPNAYRELAEYASDVTKDLATGGQCLTGVKVSLESAGVINKGDMTYPRNVNIRIKEDDTFLSIAEAHGYSGNAAEEFAASLQARIEGNIKIDNEGNLIAGKTITLRNAEGQTVRHTIQEGDTIEQIVRQYGHVGSSADEYANELYDNLLNDRVIDSNGNLIEGKLITVHHAGSPIGVARDADLYFAAHPERFEEVKYVDLGNGTSREINASDIHNLPAGYIVVYEPGAGFENQAGHIVITNGNGQGYADEVDNLRWDDFSNGKGEHGTYKIYRLKTNN